MSTVLAYLDLGTGSQIVAMLAGGFAAVVVTLKMYWNKVLVFLRIKKPEDVEAPQTPKQPDSA
jgi:hypothetical protein